MDITIGADGGKNCHVTIQGQMRKVPTAPVPIVVFSELAGAPKKLRIDGVQFAIQEKMGFNLFWIMGEVDFKIILPLESRGGFDFEKTKPLSSPDGALGIALMPFNLSQPPMGYLIQLDMTKQ
jgi:hypothetical protein